MAADDEPDTGGEVVVLCFRCRVYLGWTRCNCEVEFDHPAPEGVKVRPIQFHDDPAPVVPLRDNQSDG